MAILSVAGVALSSSMGSATLRPSAPYSPPASGPVGDVIVTLLDKTLTPRMLINFTSLTATLRYNAVGSWAIIAPYSDALWTEMMKGDFSIEVDWRGMFKFGGKCEQPGYQDSIPGAGSSSSEAGPYITMSGGDYLALIANRIAYPDNTTAWPSISKGAASVFTNVHLESALKGYVYVNGGANSLSNRIMPYLDIATDLSRGNLISYSVKFSPNVSLNLLDILRLLIIQGSGPTGMGITVQRSGSRLVFDTYIPRDLTKKAWFSKQLGNLTAVQLYLTDPTCTNALVAGSGTAMVEKVAASRTVWNVAEQYLDQTSETDVNNLNASAQQTLLAGGFGPLLNATVTDLPFLTFGRDYYLGDLVTIEVIPGNSYADVVTSVDLTAIAGQDPVYSITPSVGHSGDATATDQSVTGQLITRVRNLEKRLNTR